MADSASKKVQLPESSDTCPLPNSQLKQSSQNVSIPNAEKDDGSQETVNSISLQKSKLPLQFGVAELKQVFEKIHEDGGMIEGTPFSEFLDNWGREFEHMRRQMFLRKIFYIVKELSPATYMEIVDILGLDKPRVSELIQELVTKLGAIKAIDKTNEKVLEKFKVLKSLSNSHRADKHYGINPRFLERYPDYGNISYADVIARVQERKSNYFTAEKAYALKQKLDAEERKARVESKKSLSQRLTEVFAQQPEETVTVHSIRLICSKFFNKDISLKKARDLMELLLSDPKGILYKSEENEDGKTVVRIRGNTT
ncbi:MAG TPA: hypothetical protein VJJ82_00370 [Candidatus Nanoarchaeia archaeon]|nr:hypothetical protein [Candidatus Nanoarchaeia archaeon]